jgi:outer membrane protein OmpA-like peptidoglycan-associated protein
VDALRQYLSSPSAEPTRRFTFADLTFDVATADLTPQAVPTLDGIATALGGSPNARILVEGHTDVTGNPEDNQRLSLARAQAVKDALVARGVGADRIDVAGRGQDVPVASNDTEEERAKNRRTEIVVTR